ncbi:hypothetical protein ACQR3P_18455 [Rhodococcus sp. IEGM1300]
MDNQAQMLDLAELKRLAEAATPGVWERADGCECSVSESGDEAYWSWEQAGPAQVHGSGNQPVADADFIAAARPAVVLALIADNTRLADCAHRRRAECTAMGDALTEILRVTRLGDAAFGIACLVLGELSSPEGERQ